MIVNMHDAKTNLSDLIARVEAGETVCIARNNRPIVKLVKLEPSDTRPGFGALGHLFAEDDLKPDLFAPLDEDALRALGLA